MTTSGRGNVVELPLLNKAKEQARKYRATPKGKSKNAEMSRRCRRRKQDFLIVYRHARGCDSCEERDPDVLEFDHIEPRGKSGKGKTINTSMGWQALLEELARCNVLCANCHRKRTAEQRRAGDLS